MARTMCQSRNVSAFCKMCSKCELWANFKEQATAALDLYKDVKNEIQKETGSD